VYAVVAFAPESMIEDLRKVRAGCPASGVPVPDCHLALAPTLSARPEIPADLAGFRPFSVRTTEPVVVEGDVLLPVEHSEPLRRLRARLGVDDAAAPFVPVVRAIAPERVEEALRALAGWRVNYSWVVRDLDVISLYEGKIWRSLGRLNFGRL
jgi:hypothetical protein